MSCPGSRSFLRFLNYAGHFVETMYILYRRTALAIFKWFLSWKFFRAAWTVRCSADLQTLAVSLLTRSSKDSLVDQQTWLIQLVILLFNNLEPAKSLVDTYLLMINLSWQISTNCLLILKSRNSFLLVEIVFIRLQVFRPRLRKQILSLLSERNFTMDRNLLNEVGCPPLSLTDCA